MAESDAESIVVKTDGIITLMRLPNPPEGKEILVTIDIGKYGAVWLPYQHGFELGAIVGIELLIKLKHSPKEELV